MLDMPNDQSILGVANQRLLTELNQLEKYPLAGCIASPREENIFQWTAVIDGPENTVYEGGTFFVELVFGEDYPFSAPKVKLIHYTRTIFISGGLPDKDISLQYQFSREDLHGYDLFKWLEFSQHNF